MTPRPLGAQRRTSGGDAAALPILTKAAFLPASRFSVRAQRPQDKRIPAALYGWAGRRMHAQRVGPSRGSLNSTKSRLSQATVRFARHMELAGPSFFTCLEEFP